MSQLFVWLPAGIVMVGVLVIVHEAGHWVVAKLFGVGTPVFSIGFGPRIFGFRLWDTDFRVSVLPVGGYVRMAGADPFGEEVIDEDVDPAEDFMAKPVWQRFLIMLAGPAANLILPFVLFSAVLMLGEPQPDAIVGDVRPGSMAAEQGIQPGDRLVALDGTAIDNWREFMLGMGSVDGPFALTVKRGDDELTVQFPDWSEDQLGRVVEGLGLFHHQPSSLVGVTDPTSPAWAAGLRPGDRITKVDGTDVRTWRQLDERLTLDRAHTLDIVHHKVVEVESGILWTTTELELRPETRTVELVPAADYVPEASEPVQNPWGLVPASVFVGFVDPESSADEAGVKRGDRLVAIDGSMVRTWEDVIEYVGRTTKDLDVVANPPRSGCVVESENKVYGKPLKLDLIRDGAPVQLTFAPTVHQQPRPDGTISYRPIMGVSQFGDAFEPGAETVQYYTPIKAASRAIDEAQQVVRLILNSLGNLVSGQVALQNSVGGPVEIFRSAGYAAQQGIFHYARLMGVISVSLGIVNLLPIPVLDGGQILFYAIEGVRGRPLPLVLRERIQMVGVLFLASLMVVVFVLDIGRALGG